MLLLPFGKIRRPSQFSCFRGRCGARRIVQITLRRAVIRLDRLLRGRSFERAGSRFRGASECGRCGVGRSFRRGSFERAGSRFRGASERGRCGVDRSFRRGSFERAGRRFRGTPERGRFGFGGIFRYGSFERAGRRFCGTPERGRSGIDRAGRGGSFDCRIFAGFCGRKHARSVAVDAYRNPGSSGSFGRLHAILFKAFFQAIRVLLAARLRFRFGQLAVVAELDRRGIAELFGRRVREKLVFHAALGRAHRFFHILLELGGKLAP